MESEPGVHTDPETAPELERQTAGNSAGATILLIEDDPYYGPRWVRVMGRHYRDGNGPQLVLVTNQTAAREAFQRHRGSLIAAFIDGCVPPTADDPRGDQLDTLDLIREFRATGYKGSLVACSHSFSYRQGMMAAGCSAECDKSSVPQCAIELADVPIVAS